MERVASYITEMEALQARLAPKRKFPQKTKETPADTGGNAEEEVEGEEEGSGRTGRGRRGRRQP